MKTYKKIASNVYREVQTTKKKDNVICEVCGYKVKVKPYKPGYGDMCREVPSSHLPAHDCKQKNSEIYKPQK
jgi:DNA-directed RNA polymerase subunit RPC12/RpoP